MRIRSYTRRNDGADDASNYFNFTLASYDKQGSFGDSLIPDDPSHAAPIELYLPKNETWENVIKHIPQECFDSKLKAKEREQYFKENTSPEFADLDAEFCEHCQEIIRGEYPGFWLVNAEVKLYYHEIVLTYGCKTSEYLAMVELFLIEDEPDAQEELSLGFRCPPTQDGFQPIYEIQRKDAYIQVREAQNRETRRVISLDLFHAQTFSILEYTEF